MARKVYEQALPHVRSKDRFHNLVGLMHYYEGRMADAIIHYKQALDLNSAEPVYWSNLGLAYRDAANLREAETAMLKAVSLDGGDKYAGRLKEIRSLIEQTGGKK